MRLYNTSVIPGIHTNIFIVTRALKKVFQVTLEYETLILKKKTTDICFDEKMANNCGEGFILTTKFYKSANDAAILTPNKQKLEGKAAVHLEGNTAKNQENTTTKQPTTRKIHANELHTKLSHPREDMMRATTITYATALRGK